MLKRNLIIAALIISALTLTGETFAQEKSGKGRKKARVNSVKSPRDVSTGQASGINTNTAPSNLGDTGTHEVGQLKNRRKAKSTNQANGNRKKPNTAFRPNPTGDGTTEQLTNPNQQQADGVAKVGLGVVGSKQKQPRNKTRRKGRKQ